MAGTSTTFDAAGFRTRIRAAMRMGLPSNEADWPTFYFADPNNYEGAGGDTDGAGDPLDWREPIAAAATPDAVPDPVQVLCAIQTENDDTTTSTSLGDFDPDRHILVFFEDEWAAIDGFTHVELGQRTYLRGKELLPRGLHDVTIRRVKVTARDA